MCPPCLNFLNWPGSSPFLPYPPIGKKRVRMEVIQKKNCPDPPYFFVQICFEPPTAPHGKKNQIGLDPLTPSFPPVNKCNPQRLVCYMKKRP